jgi:hypothetical protein
MYEFFYILYFIFLKLNFQTNKKSNTRNQTQET